MQKDDFAIVETARGMEYGEVVAGVREVDEKEIIAPLKPVLRKATKADQWDMGARIREVEQGPDGALWVLEDGADGSQGRLLKLTPKK